MDVLRELIRRNPPTTQEEACAIAVRQSLAAFGPEEPQLIRAASKGIAEGLFGPAFERASKEQRMAWIDMCERQYRAALDQASSKDEGK